MHGRPFLSVHLTRLRRSNTVVGILNHGGIPAVQGHGRLLPQHLLQVDFGPAVAVRGPVEEGPAGLEQGAGHLNVVVGEVEQELLDTEQCVHFGENTKFCHFSNKSANFKLGLDVDLVFLPDMPPEVLLEKS